MVADLHGSDEAFANTLFVLDAMDTSGTWTREGASLTLLGDILADRNEHGLEIVNRIAGLRPQIEAAGGELNVVAGNHDLFALEYVGGLGRRFSLQTVGFRELFRLAMGREPVDDKELMDLPKKEDFIEQLHEKEEAKPLLDFLTRLKLFHTAEHEGGGKTLFLHAPPKVEVLALLLSSFRDTLNARFQSGIGAYLARAANPRVLSDDLADFQWGEWFNCPEPSNSLWTDLYAQRRIQRVICGHRFADADPEVRSFGPVEAIALDRNYGMAPKATKPEYWLRSVSGGILDKQGKFTF